MAFLILTKILLIYKKARSCFEVVEFPCEYTGHFTIFKTHYNKSVIKYTNLKIGWEKHMFCQC